MQKRRFGARAACAAAGLLVLAASSAAAQTLERVRASGSFKIGYREDARPLSFVDQAGEPAGFSIDVCRTIAADVQAELGLADLSIEFLPVSTEDRFSAVADGEVDILCGASTVTLARREIVAFSIPIFLTGVSPLLRADAPPFLRNTLARLEPALPPRVALFQAFSDRKFGVRSNTTAEEWLRESITTLSSNAELVTVDSHDEGVNMVLDRDLDAYFADRAILLGSVLASEAPTDLVVGERFFTQEPYGLALTKGDEDFRLLVDRSVSRLYRSPEIEPILAEHFGSPGLDIIVLLLMNALPE